MPLPNECLDFSRDWRECDIHVEYEYRDANDPAKNIIPEPGKRTVQDQLEHWLKASAESETLIVKDHASGEIADFVEIGPSNSMVRLLSLQSVRSGQVTGSSAAVSSRCWNRCFAQ